MSVFEMKNFKKFAAVLVVVILVLIIGVFFKEYWKKLVGNVAAWICASFGIPVPGWVKKFQGYGDVDLGSDSDDMYQ